MNCTPFLLDSMIYYLTNGVQFILYDGFLYLYKDINRLNILPYRHLLSFIFKITPTCTCVKKRLEILPKKTVICPRIEQLFPFIIAPSKQKPRTKAGRICDPLFIHLLPLQHAQRFFASSASKSYKKISSLCG